MQPDVNVAQLAREHGLNDNLLFNWRHQLLGEQKENSTDTPVTLMLVEIAGSRHNIVEITARQPTLDEPDNALRCEVVLPGGPARLDGAITLALLRILLGEQKEKHP